MYLEKGYSSRIQKEKRGSDTIAILEVEAEDDVDDKKLFFETNSLLVSPLTLLPVDSQPRKTSQNKGCC